MNDYLWQTYHRLINELSIKSHRFLYDEFTVDAQMTGLVGPRGVGKTTLLLQYIKEKCYSRDDVFYFSADQTYFNQISLVEYVDQLYQRQGIRIVFIDEVHKYKNWNQELKNIYDSFPDLKIIFSGSSSIDLVHGSYDLSRRVKLIRMPGLSFREFLNIKTNNQFPALQLSEILENHIALSAHVSNKTTVLKYFNEYQYSGYYPFILDNPKELFDAINVIIDKTIYEDIAEFYQLKTFNLGYFKKILNFLATIPPGKINPSNIAKRLSADYKTIEHYLEILNKSGMVKMLHPVAHGHQLLSKPEKYFLDNTTLLAALNTFLSIDVNKGTQRELFFLQSFTTRQNPIFAPNKGDFFTDGNTFEIGGKNKKKEQLESVKEKKFIVKDDIVIGFKNEIPLYLFGFLY